MRRALLIVFIAPCGLAVVGHAQAAPTAPRVDFVNVDAGPVRGGPGGLGVPITLYGHGFGRSRGRSTVTVGGREVARYLTWGGKAANPEVETIVVQPGPHAAGGPVVVTVSGHRATAPEEFDATGGRVLVVADDGTDGASCSLIAPCSTITAALTKLHAGDALLVRGGSVTDDEVWVRKELGGRTGRPISILAYPGDRPAFTKTSRPVILEGSHVRFSGFAFPSGKSLGIGGEDGQADIRAVDNDFTGSVAYAAVSTHGDDILVAGSSCRATGSSQGTQGHCYYVSAGSRIRLVDNLASGVPGYGIHIFDQQRSSNDERRVISDVLVEGNRLAASTERSGLIVAMGDEGGEGNRIEGVTIRDNVFAQNNFAGIAIGSNVNHVHVYHNTFLANGRQGVTVYGDATVDDVTISGNLFDQRPNSACRSNCSWYARAAVEVGQKAKEVFVDGNWYAPGPPRVIGGRDRSAATGPISRATGYGVSR